MVTFLGYTTELVIDPTEPHTDSESSTRVGFNYTGTASLVYLATGRHRDHPYNPEVHTLISAHAMECGADYPAHLHTEDHDQARYAREVLHDWFAEPGNGEDMPESVREEILVHLDEIGHYLAGGVWEVEIVPFDGPTLRVGNYRTPNAAAAAVAGGQVWDLVGSHPDTDDDLIDCELSVSRVPIDRDIPAAAH